MDEERLVDKSEMSTELTMIPAEVAMENELKKEANGNGTSSRKISLFLYTLLEK